MLCLVALLVDTHPRGENLNLRHWDFFMKLKNPFRNPYRADILRMMVAPNCQQHLGRVQPRRMKGAGVYAVLQYTVGLDRITVQLRTR